MSTPLVHYCDDCECWPCQCADECPFDRWGVDTGRAVLVQFHSHVLGTGPNSAAITDESDNPWDDEEAEASHPMRDGGSLYTDDGR